MPYTPTTWNEGLAPGISAANLNNLETQFDEALDSLVELAGGDNQQPGVAGVWFDWDISGIVPAGTKMVEVSIKCGNGNVTAVGAREDGSILARQIAITDGTHEALTLMVKVAATRIIEILSVGHIGSDFSIMSYWA